MKRLPAGTGWSPGKNRARLAALAVALLVALVLFLPRDKGAPPSPSPLPSPLPSSEAGAADAVALLLKSKAALANFQGIALAETGGAYPEEFSRHGLASRYRDQGEVLDEVVEDLNRAAALKPDLAEAHHFLGVAYALRGNPHLAVAEYSQALELDPANPNTHIGLVTLLAEAGRAREAAAGLKRFEMLFPVEPEASLTLDATVALYAGVCPRAEADARELLDMDPGDAWARQVLAICLDKRGETARAGEEWARLIETDPARREEYEAARAEWKARSAKSIQGKSP